MWDNSSFMETRDVSVALLFPDRPVEAGLLSSWLTDLAVRPADFSFEACLLALNNKNQEASRLRASINSQCKIIYHPD